MKAKDFNLKNDLDFNIKEGQTSFNDSRLVIFDANAIGLLRQNLIERIGFDGAKAFFLKFGYQNGYSDFLQMKVNYEFESEMELLASGPVIHTWEGIVSAKTTKIQFDREKDEFFFTGIWENSYEAEQHLSFNEIAKEPICWSLMGYATGWCSAFFGKLVIAIEPVCKGKGDSHCEWKIQRPQEWGKEADSHLEVYKEFEK